MLRHTFPLALTATLTTLVLTGCGDDTEPTNADDPGSPTSSASSEPTSPATETSPAQSETTTDSAPAVTAPVFFVAEAPNGRRLFAEVRSLEADNPLEEAAALLVAGDAQDPDYGSLWPSGSFESIEYDGEKFVVTVPDDGWNTRPAGMSAAEAKLSVQQLVYTLQAVEGADEPVVVVPTGLLLGVDASTVGAADPLAVRGLANVYSPAEGETVSGTFTASGEASSFEATVPWQVRDAAGATVLEGFSTAEGYMDDLYPWQAEVDVSGLEPGTYTFVAMTDDPSGGDEGFGPTEDSKTIVVE